MLPMTHTEIESFLDGALIGRLCMADDTGAPYAIPLPFCWHDGSLYLRLPLSGRKGRVLAANNRVCFEVDHFTTTLDDYASVLIEGTLVEVTDLDEKRRVKELNTNKYNRLRGGHRPGHGRVTPVENLPMRKILVQQLTGLKKPPTSSANSIGTGISPVNKELQPA